MKNKNIAFSGFMAAIMLSTGAAMAAPQIASKAYVDNKSASAATAAVTAALNENGAIKTALDAKADASTVEAVKSTAETAKSTAEAANATATANKSAIENEQTGLAATKKVADEAATAAANAATKADTAQAAATANAGEISTLKETVAGKQDALGYTAENAANKIATLSTTASEEEQARTYPTAGAVISYVTGKFDEITDGISVDTNKITDGAITETKIQDDAITTNKIANGAVTEDKLSTELATKVNNAQTSEQVSAAIVDAIKDKADKATTLEGYGITDAMTETEIKAYAIPKPEGTCANSVNRCVLSVDTTDGQNPKMVWMDITSPLDE